MRRVARLFARLPVVAVSAAGIGAACVSLEAASASAKPPQKAATAQAKDSTHPTGTTVPVRAWDANNRASLPAWTGDIREDFHSLVLSIQDEICAAIAHIDGAPFLEDLWTRPEGGGGRTRVLQDGKVFEKAGVNVSSVHGNLPAAAVVQMRSRGNAHLGGPGPFPFYACGVSLVMHPKNPQAPTVHANYRYFEVLVPDADAPGGQRRVWWFGGGADLTPSYLHDEDAVHFHAVHKVALDTFDTSLYPRFKKWCDSYFNNSHRGNERRGIGGIFFDDVDGSTLPVIGAEFLTGSAGATGGAPKSADKHSASPGAANAGSPYDLLPLVTTCARAFLPAYLPVLLRTKDLPFTEQHKHWQQLRRGR